MLKKKLTSKEKLAEKVLKLAIEKAQYERDWKAMSFCLSHGFTVYPALQLGGVKLRVFMQKGTSFQKVDDVLYDQDKPEDVMKMIYVIDQKYKEVYEKNKK